MKLFKYITIALSSLFMCGCSDYLDNAPDDTLTMEMVFNDRTRTEDWLSGVYNRVPDTYWALLRTWRIAGGDTILWGMILIRRNVGTNGGETL